jgi:hypothetical protein
MELPPGTPWLGRLMNMSEQARFGGGQLITAVALVGFSVPLLVAGLLDPTKGNLGDARLDIADVGAHPRAFLASTVLLLVSTIALLPATAGLWRIGRARRQRLTGVGAGLAVLGALGHAALVTFYGFLYEMPAGNLDEMVGLLNRVNEGLVLVLFFPMLLALAIGLIVLTLALWRGGIAPLWCFIAACVIFLIDFLPAAVPGASIIVAGLVVVTTGGLAIAVLRMPASAWDGTETTAPEPSGHAAMSS